MMIEGYAVPHTVEAEAEAARFIMDLGRDAANSNASGERPAGFQAQNE